MHQGCVRRSRGWEGRGRGLAPRCLPIGLPRFVLAIEADTPGTCHNSAKSKQLTQKANELAWHFIVCDHRHSWIPATPEESQVRCPPFKKEYALFLKKRVKLSLTYEAGLILAVVECVHDEGGEERGSGGRQTRGQAAQGHRRCAQDRAAQHSLARHLEHSLPCRVTWKNKWSIIEQCERDAAM
uniref:SFRICE_002955 n=1 Tax=Spodoptera frugiperda TaxID=7108 RepID=A0A2H1WH53_SPOFR